jgi:hypothetical protein
LFVYLYIFVEEFPIQSLPGKRLFIHIYLWHFQLKELELLLNEACAGRRKKPQVKKPQVKMLQAVGKKPLDLKNPQVKARGQLDEGRKVWPEYVEEESAEKKVVLKSKAAPRPKKMPRGKAGQMPGGHRPLAGLKENTVARLVHLQERKKAIRCEKNQLDVDEANVDEEIASLEEELYLAVKEEEEKEEDVEEEEDVADEEEEEDVAVKEEEEDVEGEEGEEVKDVEEEEEENTVWNELEYAWMWHDQGGNDSTIPKGYTPCKYFFKTRDGCQVSNCQFSHNRHIFDSEPFATVLKNLSWHKRAKKKTLLPRPPPFPPPPGPLKKKHRQVKRDEEDEVKHRRVKRDEEVKHR